jgi:sigma-B regulation protein RsbQ
MDPITRNNVQVSGRGERTLVFGHGFGTDLRAWRWVAPAFEDTCRVVLFDHLGFGASDLAAYRESRHGQLEGYARDVLDVLDAVGAARVTYIGHSAGGMIGLLASILAPDRFERLGLIGASPRFIDEPPDYVGGFKEHEIEHILDLMERDQIAWADMLAPLAIGPDAQPDITSDFRVGLRGMDPLVARRFGRLVFGMDLRARLAEVTVPSLILHCTQDSIVPIQVAHYLHEHLRASQLREFDAHGHCPHLTHPRETVRLVQEYLDANVP